MKTFKTLAFALMGAMLAGCSDDANKQDYAPEKNIEISRAQSESMNHIADFSLKIFKNAYLENKENENGNFVIAPFNLATSLAMVGNAADQRTKDMLLTAFNMKTEGLEALNRMFEIIISEMPELDPQSQLILANSVWTDIDTVVPQWYIDKMSASFKAPVTVVDDMKAQESVDKINQWINTATNGKLDYKVNYWNTVAEMFNIKYFATLNALYFKGQWRQKFDKANTKAKTFYNADGTTSQPMMMRQSLNVCCEDLLDNTGHRLGYAVRLPYGNNSFGLNLFLPDKNVALDDYVDYLANGGWTSYVNARHPESETTVELPRFEINSSLQLIDVLRNSGFDFTIDDNESIIFFDKEELQFSSSQQTIFRLDEEGSEAISITHTLGNNGDIAYFRSITFDRPFIFILSERSTGAILTAGCVNTL